MKITLPTLNDSFTSREDFAAAVEKDSNCDPGEVYPLVNSARLRDRSRHPFVPFKLDHSDRFSSASTSASRYATPRLMTHGAGQRIAAAPKCLAVPFRLQHGAHVAGLFLATPRPSSSSDPSSRDFKGRSSHLASDFLPGLSAWCALWR